MQILTTNNLNELRKKVQEILKKNKERKSEEQEKIAVLTQEDEFNRKVLEMKIDCLIINESLGKKDYSKQRNSDLNEVLAKIAAKNNIKIAIDMDKIIAKSDTEKAKSLARLKQNIMLCKKSGAKLVFLSDKKSNRDLPSILISLGATTSQASQAIKQAF